jgi:hypothetical protein
MRKTHVLASNAQLSAVIVVATRLGATTKPSRNEVINVTVPPSERSTEANANPTRDDGGENAKHSKPVMTRAPPSAVQNTGPA